MPFEWLFDDEYCWCLNIIALLFCYSWATQKSIRFMVVVITCLLYCMMMRFLWPWLLFDCCVHVLLILMMNLDDDHLLQFRKPCPEPFLLFVRVIVHVMNSIATTLMFAWWLHDVVVGGLVEFCVNIGCMSHSQTLAAIQNIMNMLRIYMNMSWLFMCWLLVCLPWELDTLLQCWNLLLLLFILFGMIMMNAWYHCCICPADWKL